MSKLLNVALFHPYGDDPEGNIKKVKELQEIAERHGIYLVFPAEYLRHFYDESKIEERLQAIAKGQEYYTDHCCAVIQFIPEEIKPISDGILDDLANVSFDGLITYPATIQTLIDVLVEIKSKHGAEFIESKPLPTGKDLPRHQMDQKHED